MTTMTAWPGRAESWLDDRGRGAWLAALVLALIVFWPAGLVLGGYMIWSGRLFARAPQAGRGHAHLCRGHARRHGFRTSGNSAFDAYKADTLDRLEREQAEFEAFLRRLRDSKDKAEFDQYLAGRSAAAGGTAEAEAAEAAAGRADPPADGDAGHSGT
ncbi:MAG: hypothetical protein CVT84_14050, partial [Alphaproteobacteria bacterium HGW-Alphaproteobacteria-6]